MTRPATPPSAAVRRDVPFFDLSGEIAEDAPELAAAAEAVLRSGRYVLGPEVEAFEEEVARYVGVRHAVGVNSGTDALVLALEVLGIGPGDEVVTTPFTFFATAEAVRLVGATPVFADVDEETFQLDPRRVEEVLTPRTRALLPVHLFGQAAPVGELSRIAERHGLALCEDAAQGIGVALGGVRCGALGDLAAFSFYPTKNLGACGDGGMVTTDDAALADRVRLLRNHGSTQRDRCETVGYNSRLDSLQAALLRVKLAKLEARNDARRRIAARYREGLDGVEGLVLPSVPAGVTPTWHQYTVRVLDGRDRARAALAEAGVGSMVYYGVPVHRLEPFAAGARGPLPVAEALAGEVLSLPVYPTLSEDAQDRVVSALRGALAP